VRQISVSDADREARQLQELRGSRELQQVLNAAAAEQQQQRQRQAGDDGAQGVRNGAGAGGIPSGVVGEGLASAGGQAQAQAQPAAPRSLAEAIRASLLGLMGI
jgi:hypothetical protein